MNTGKIKWYDETKGYGFIETTEGKDVFVHHSGLKNRNASLENGQEVSFEIKQTDRGDVAVNVE